MEGQRVFHLTRSDLILGFQLLKIHTKVDLFETESYIIEAYFLHQNLNMLTSVIICL